MHKDRSDFFYNFLFKKILFSFSAMNNLEDSYGTEMEPIILIPELEDTQKTDEKVSLNSEKKSKNLPPIRTPSRVWILELL